MQRASRAVGLLGVRGGLQGSCHCGNVHVTFSTRKAVEDLSVRACQCSFCRKHGSVMTSDPGGRVVFAVRDGRALGKYRFAFASAEFLVCKRCGVLAGVLMSEGAAGYAVVNVNVFPERERFAAPQKVDFDGEAEETRRARRRAMWSPAVLEIGRARNG